MTFQEQYDDMLRLLYKRDCEIERLKQKLGRYEEALKVLLTRSVPLSYFSRDELSICIEQLERVAKEALKEGSSDT